MRPRLDTPLGVPAGPLYAWWRGEPLPRLAATQGLDVRKGDAGVLAELDELDVAEAERRVARGHVPYVAYLHGKPLAYGWSATREAAIGELGIAFHVPIENRYLWDFVTLPAARGQGIYPRLLQAILEYEVDEASRFWIGHEPENTASARGITKAGFTKVGELYFRSDGHLEMSPTTSRDRAFAGSQLLGVPLAAIEAPA